MCKTKTERSDHKYIYSSQKKIKKKIRKRDGTSKNNPETKRFSFCQTSSSGLPFMPLKFQAELEIIPV